MEPHCFNSYVVPSFMSNLYGGADKMKKVPIRGLLIFYLFYISFIVWSNVISEVIALNIKKYKFSISTLSELTYFTIALFVYIIIIYLFFKRNRLLPIIVILFEMGVLLINGSDLLTLKNSLVTIIDTITLSLVNCFWIYYFSNSNRVKMTFN